MKITLNGDVRELPEGMTVGALLELLAAPRGGVAVARNDCVVRASAYDSDRIAEGDRLEIIRAVAGG